MSSQLPPEVSDPASMFATDGGRAVLPEPLRTKLVELEELFVSAQELATALEAAQRPRSPGSELDNTRPFTRRTMHKKNVNERLLAFARGEVRLLLAELDLPARDRLCANSALRDRTGFLVGTDIQGTLSKI